MSDIEYLTDGEYESAVAATAYVITTLEEAEDSLKQKKTVEGLTRTKSKAEEKTARTSFNWSFKWLSGTEANEDKGQTEVLAETILHKSVDVERAARENYADKYTEDGEETETLPTARKTTNINKKNTNEEGTNRLGSGKTMEKTKASFTRKTTEVSSGYKKMEKVSNKYGEKETEADVWEKAELINANNRYEKMMSWISEWQMEKKKKAERQMERKQGEPEDKRVKALQRYNNKVSKINKIAGDARALAKERRQNDEAKIRERAAKIRLTGKVPGAYCTCC